jgi:hypothetical protein
MSMLSATALDEIARYDVARRAKLHLPNRNRFYKYLLPCGQDMEIHTAACRTRRDGTIAVKEVVQASVDDPWIHIRDVAHYMIAGYIVDWSPEKLGPKKPWDYHGRWETDAYAPRCKWKIKCDVVNPEALLAHPRFRYCAWSPACGDILDYLKVYRKNPRIELLAKAGAERFCTRGGFAKRLAADKNLLRFFMANLDEITRLQYGVDAIALAYRDRITISEAGARIGDRRKFSGHGLPRQVDASKALAYTIRAKCGNYEYCRYLRNCQRLGLDLADTKNTFPRRFKHRSQILADQVAEIDRREKAEMAKAQDAQIAAVAKRFARLERSQSAFRVMLPRRTTDLIREGKRLHNCLGDGHYAAKMARGETLVAFVRRATRPGAAFVAVEYSPDQKRVLQCYAAKNGKPPAPVMKFVERWFAKLRAVA